MKPTGQEWGYPGPQQVHPGSTAGHQRSSGEYGGRRPLFLQQECDVLRGVSRTVNDPELEFPQVYLIIFFEPQRWEQQSPRRAGSNLATGFRHQLSGA